MDSSVAKFGKKHSSKHGSIAPNRVLFFSVKKYQYFTYFSMKIYVVVLEALLMITHNMFSCIEKCFHREIQKILR